MTSQQRIKEFQIIKSVAKKFQVPENDVKLVSYQHSGGSAQGENYMGHMVIIEADVQIKDQPTTKAVFMVKCAPPQSENSMDFITESGMFITECDGYQKIIPAANKYLENSKFSLISVPENFYSSAEEGLLFMENLKLSHYDTIAEARTKGLDLPFVKLFLERLATFHATTYHFVKTYHTGLSGFLNDFQELKIPGFFMVTKDMVEITMGLYTGVINAHIKVIKEFYPSEEELIKKLERYANESLPKLIEVQKARECDFNCVIHGDAWLNNIMFRVDNEGIPDDLKIIDLQLLRYAKPTLDLAFFFGSSTSPSFREIHLDECLSFYHEKLTELLIYLGYTESTYPKAKFLQDFDESNIFSYATSIEHSQMAFIDPESPDALKGEDFKDAETRYATMSEKQYEKRFVNSGRSCEKLRKRWLEIATDAARRRII